MQWQKLNIYFKGLSNMCNIAHVKTTNSSKILLENNNYSLKSFIFNIKCTNSNTKYSLTLQYLHLNPPNKNLMF